MDPITIIAILNALAELTPKVYLLATQAQATLSTNDAAAVAKALADAQAAAGVDLSQALTDLDEAAKK